MRTRCDTDPTCDPGALFPDSVQRDAIAVDLHTVRLGAGRHDLAACWELLDAGERARAERFLFERDRLRWVACRARLRRILAARCDIPAERLRFETLSNGKPALTPECNPSALEFNLSHSHDLAVIAVTGDGDVGVDIEKERDFDGMPDLAQRFFAREESVALGALSATDRRRAFYRCWTRKEAVLKACGAGLSLGLEAFAVSVGPEARLLRWRDDDDSAGCWQLANLELSAGYVGALALRSERACTIAVAHR